MAHKVLKNQIFLKKIYMPAFFLVCCLVCCLMTTTIAWSSPWQLSNQLLHLKRLSITQEKTKHEGKTKHNFRPLHTSHETAKISMKKVAVKIVAHIKTVEKNCCSCEKKLHCVWKITAFIAPIGMTGALQFPSAVNTNLWAFFADFFFLKATPAQQGKVLKFPKNYEYRLKP